MTQCRTPWHHIQNCPPSLNEMYDISEHYPAHTTPPQPLDSDLDIQLLPFDTAITPIWAQFPRPLLSHQPPLFWLKLSRPETSRLTARSQTILNGLWNTPNWMHSREGWAFLNFAKDCNAFKCLFLEGFATRITSFQEERSLTNPCSNSILCDYTIWVQTNRPVCQNYGQNTSDLFPWFNLSLRFNIYQRRVHRHVSTLTGQVDESSNTTRLVQTRPLSSCSYPSRHTHPVLFINCELVVTVLKSNLIAYTTHTTKNKFMKLPLFSWASGCWIGDVPAALLNLTYAEELVIAQRHYKVLGQNQFWLRRPGHPQRNNSQENHNSHPRRSPERRMSTP
ncbi:hypothetical protein C8R43DRAFT_941692 [Mycena crocata]|nr:hypothetical protein C8R43DRAFT_941692 [Mycena crocata]